MKERHTISIKSDQRPVVEIDSQAHAAYVRFSKKKVARTSPVTTNGCVITIDFDSKDEVVGVEIVGVVEFDIKTILAKAGVPISKRLAEKARYVPANLQAA